MNRANRNLHDYSGQSQYKIGDDAGGEHVACGNRTHVEASQDTLFAKHYESGAKPPEASHYRESDHRTQQIPNAGRRAFCEDSGVEEEESRKA